MKWNFCVVVAMMSIGLLGCGNDRELEDLRQEVRQLQRENERLEDEVSQCVGSEDKENVEQDDGEIITEDAEENGDVTGTEILLESNSEQVDDSAGYEDDTEGMIVEVNTMDINVRVSADASSQKVGTVSTGEKFTVLGSTTGVATCN